MTAALNRRLRALEAVQRPHAGPQVIFISCMRPKDEEQTDDDIRAAFIIGTSPENFGCELSREDGEASASFLARVEAERVRVHGPKA